MRNDEQPSAENAEWQAWDPGRYLRTFSANEVRFSAGFMQLDFGALFPHLQSLWAPLFLSLGAQVQLHGIEKTFELPQNLKRKYVIEIDNELGMLALDSRAERAFANAVAPHSTGAAADVSLDYLERRLLATLTKTWGGSSPVNFLHVSDRQNANVAVAGAVHLSLVVNGTGCDVWFGLGARVMEKLDNSARAEGESGPPRRSSHAPKDLITIELAELFVPPELLIDYLRSETIIGLDLPVRTDVIVRLNDEPWALGRLGQYRSKFAVEMVDFNPESIEDSAGNTRLRVELVRLELEVAQRKELEHRGAVLLSDVETSPNSTLVISGESVGEAIVGTIGGQFALNVLGKLG
ncbi:MAG: hypothetical protein IT290_10335 [Deltaproteobacteria bacterium]|nr:hypothetical protein [Deltaproteobacteria bacterium]